jgi:hypothetical protein
LPPAAAKSTNSISSSRTSALVSTIGRLVHALQRERGISNVLLASARPAALPTNATAQIAECAGARAGGARMLRRGSKPTQAAPATVPRLFSRIAWVVPGLDALPALRKRIGARTADAGGEATWPPS